MDKNQKRLVQLRTSLQLCKLTQEKVEDVLEGDLTTEELSEELHGLIGVLESQLEDHKLEMNLSEEEWNEDEGDIDMEDLILMNILSEEEPPHNLFANETDEV